MTTSKKTATDLAKIISKNKDQFSSEARKVARRLLSRSVVERDAMLPRWIPALAEVLELGNSAAATLEDIEQAVSPAEKKTEKPAAKKTEKPAEKKTEKPAEKKTVKPAEKKTAKPSAHVPVRIKDVAKAISQTEGTHLGDLCGWSLTGARPKAEVEAAAAKYGLEDDLAFPKNTPNACYRKAISQVFTVGKSDRSGKPMARLVEDSTDRLVHSIVSSKVVEDENDSVSTKDVEFQTEIKVGFDKKAYREGASAEGCLVVEDPNHPAAAELKAIYLGLAETYITNDIRGAFQVAFRNWDACPVLPHGGLWYIPSVNAEKVRAWNGFMTEIRMTTVVIPCFDTTETIESLRQATENSLEGQLGDLLWYLDQYAKAGWDTVRTGTLEKRVNEFDELRNRAELYQSILGTTVTDLQEKVERCAKKLTSDISVRNEEETAEAEKAEKEAAEKKAEKAAAREAVREAKKIEREAARATKKAEKAAAKMAAEKTEEKTEEKTVKKAKKVAKKSRRANVQNEAAAV